jgi:hypothetical protein
VRSGPAVVRDPHRGYAYVAEQAVYDGNAVTFTGRLRTQTLTGVQFGVPRSFTLPIARVEVEWLDGPSDGESEACGAGS